MPDKRYAGVSAAVFTLIACGQLARAVNGWAVQVADRQIPLGVSWGAFAVAAMLAVWGFRAASR